MKTTFTPLFDTLDNFSENTSAVSYPHPEDYSQAVRFLYSYRGSLATFNAYRREIERFLQWLQHVARLSLKQVKREDIENYLYFCQKPFDDWIATKRSDRYIEKEGLRIPNPEWRPFVTQVSKMQRLSGKLPQVKQYSLSQKALQAIFAILGSFYTYLIEEAYVEHNPVSQIRQKSKFIRKNQAIAPVRRLSELQWSYVIETAREEAQKNPEVYERTLFMLTMLYGMYLRISELAASPRWEPQMGHFECDSDDHWWFRTVGKGNKERLIVVSDAMLEGLKRYRKFLGLTGLPSPGETTPLVSKTTSAGPITSTRQIRAIVQEAFDKALSRMEADGLSEDAEQLKSATVHWLRHTGISDDVKVRPREHVRDDAGHSSSAITDRYIDVELRERHASGRKKQIAPV